MTLPSPPDGYDTAHLVAAGRSGCFIGFGFDRDRDHIPRFIVQLHYLEDAEGLTWDRIARMDHNETAALGHDVYREGLHVDVFTRSGSAVHLALSHPPLPANRGRVIRGCLDYFRREGDFFVDVYEERRHPGDPPRWSDGGETSPTLITQQPVVSSMSREAPAAEEVLTLEEANQLLAEATDTAPEEIARGVEIDPPEEAEVVGYDGDE